MGSWTGGKEHRGSPRAIFRNRRACPFTCLATIQVNTIDEFQALFAKHGAEIMADIPNYTNIEPFVQFDEIVA